VFRERDCIIKIFLRQEGEFSLCVYCVELTKNVAL
jgi:hypothetical protein